ncbi:MAG TPA: acetyl-CoA C-acetyltransferase [Enteractinococcus sp.]
MTFNPEDAVIVATGRSPIGRARKGSLVEMRPDDLLAQVTEAVINKVPAAAERGFEDFLVGCAEPHDEQGFNIARNVAVLLGHDDLPGATINRFCASSLQALRNAFHGIRSGEGDAYLIGGVETVSRFRPQHEGTENPKYADAKERVSRKLAAGQWCDPRDEGHLPDIYIPMGHTAEFVAQHTNTSREAQDRYAARSQQRAVAAQQAGFMEREIIPITTPSGETVTVDDGPRPNTTVETLAELQPVFTENGTVTAGNACPLNDGAAAAVVMSGRRAKELGLQPLARIVSSAVTALSPEIMGLGPVEASRVALKRAGLTAADLDAVELNEAFAAQVVPTIEQLGLDEDIVNPHGGAIALGHPFGATGIRMIGTLINDLQTLDGTYGLSTLCVGGGQGMGMVIERL